MRDEEIIEAIMKMPDDMASEMMNMFESYKQSLNI